MKINLIILFGILAILISSCSEQKNTVEDPEEKQPTIHDPIDLDIDEDGIMDYKIRYSAADIEPLISTGGTYAIYANLESYSYGKNEILRQKEEQDLFLRDLDKIEGKVAEPLIWHSGRSILVSITTLNTEGDWPDKWDIKSETEQSTYFIGLKMIDDDDLVQLAWIELDIDSSNGMISVVNKGIL